MADVQLEHGYYRLANALDEAITWVSFTVTQHKIIRCVLRMTFGWRQRTVRISVGALAERCNVAYSGSFRRALGTLIREGVIIEVQRPAGSRPGLYAINKNHEEWGKFSVAARTIQRLFRDRISGDDAMLAGSATQPDLISRPSEGEQQDHPVRPLTGEQPSPSGNGDSRPLGGRKAENSLALLEGESRSRNSNGTNEFRRAERHIDSLSIEKQTTTTGTAPVGLSQQSSFAIRLTSAMNAAISKRWGEQPNPLTFGQCQQLAADLILEGFTDLDVARPAIDDACATSRQPTPPGHPNYFRNVIRSAHQSAQQKAFDETESRKRTSHHAPTSVAQVLDPGSVERESKLKRDYESAINAFAMKWAKKPENENAVRTIHLASNAKFGGIMETRWGQVGRDQDILERCRDACGFPDFDDWRRERDRTHMDRTPDQTTPATTAGDST